MTTAAMTRDSVDRRGGIGRHASPYRSRLPADLHHTGRAVRDFDALLAATIIGAPSSTKNADKQRYPEMLQTRKGKQWFFGMKLHIGVDTETGLVHSAVVTAANVHDKYPLSDLLHGHEQRVYGDCAYASQGELIQAKAPNARDFANKTVRKGSVTEDLECLTNRAKSRVRARVEHVFAVVKRLWGFGKARYRGLAKNATRAFVATGLANIFLARRHLMA